MHLHSVQKVHVQGSCTLCYLYITWLVSLLLSPKMLPYMKLTIYAFPHQKLLDLPLLTRVQRPMFCDS